MMVRTVVGGGGGVASSTYIPFVWVKSVIILCIILYMDDYHGELFLEAYPRSHMVICAYVIV